MDAVLFQIGRIPVTLAAASVAGGLLFALVVIFAVAAARRARAARSAETEARLAELGRLQGEMAGRMQAVAEMFGSRQADLARSLGERLDGLGHRLGQTMTDTTRHTYEGLSKLNERLVAIDTAQKNITQLSGEVVSLQHILANKQTRGAFGQARMEAIVQDGLPAGSYAFQATLSNRTRPDCLIRLPNGAPGIVIDAKFPLEAWNAIRAAGNAGGDPRAAQAQFRRDVRTHIAAIRERYFLPGETQDTAFMFVPSESIFADIHEHFEDVVQHAHRNRVVIVSPSLLLLSIQTVQAVLRDARIKDQAHFIRDEVMKLMEDVGRLDERVRALQNHHAQGARDIDQILTSTRKITGRAERIEGLDLGESPPVPGATVTPLLRRQPDLLAGE